MRDELLARIEAARDGTIAAVAALRAVYTLGEPPGAVLRSTLTTITEAWGHSSEGLVSALLRGIALYHHDHRDVEPADLAGALVRGPGAPINMLGWSKALAGQTRMPLDRAVARIIEDRVMKNRRRSVAKKKED